MLYLYISHHRLGKPSRRSGNNSGCRNDNPTGYSYDLVGNIQAQDASVRENIWKNTGKSFHTTIQNAVAI